MGLINDTVWVTRGIKAKFTEVFYAQPSLVSGISTVITSDGPSETYGWLSESPTMQEFVDTRQVKGFSDTSYAITNKTWEATIGVKRAELEDDQAGAIQMRVTQVAQRTAQHPNKLLIDALVNGTTDTGYDGVAFFSDTHPIRGEQSATQDNLLAGTGTTVATFKTDIQTALATMKAFKDERDEPFWEDFDPANLWLICHPNVEWNAREALEATIISNTTNVLSGAVGNVYGTARLSDTNDWYLLYCGAAVRPLIFQDRTSVELLEQAEGSDGAFWTDSYHYGVRARYNVGYGFWQFAVKTTNA